MGSHRVQPELSRQQKEQTKQSRRQTPQDAINAETRHERTLGFPRNQKSDVDSLNEPKRISPKRGKIEAPSRTCCCGLGVEGGGGMDVGRSGRKMWIPRARARCQPTTASIAVTGDSLSGANLSPGDPGPIKIAESASDGEADGIPNSTHSRGKSSFRNTSFSDLGQMPSHRGMSSFRTQQRAGDERW